MTAARARELVEAISSSDRATQGAAYEELLAATSTSVPWADDVWPAVVEGLSAADNRQRSICAQVLADLAAYSDPEHRILADLDRLAAVMSDDRFVTARHATQALWKVGLGGDEPCAATIAVLSERFRTCGDEKNAGLIRTDIVAALARLDEARPDAGIEQAVQDLIASEPDAAARRKQQAAWRKARNATT